jgi:hypothetical protein
MLPPKKWKQTPNFFLPQIVKIMSPKIGTEGIQIIYPKLNGNYFPNKWNSTPIKWKPTPKKFAFFLPPIIWKTHPQLNGKIPQIKRNCP